MDGQAELAAQSSSLLYPYQNEIARNPNCPTTARFAYSNRTQLAAIKTAAT